MSKEVIQKFEKEVWNGKEMAKIKAYFHPDVVIHSPLGNFKGVGEIEKIISKWTSAIENMKVHNLHLIEEGDRVVSHWNCEGILKGKIGRAEAHGKAVSYQGMTLFKFHEGKVSEYWAYIDSWSLENQTD